MSHHEQRPGLQRAARCAAAATAILLGAAATAAAAVPAPPAQGDRLTLTVPRDARAGEAHHVRPYQVTVRGYSSSQARLLVFVDYDLCQSSVAAERADGAPETSLRVAGGFTRSTTWESGVPRRDHACAYLVDQPSQVLLAHAFASFTVHAA